MTKSGLSKSVRKFIRTEKARIRATVLDMKKQEEMIMGLYNKFGTISTVEAIKAVETSGKDTKISNTQSPISSKARLPKSKTTKKEGLKTKK